MKKSSVLMVLSAILVVIGIVVCVIGAVNGVAGIISITPNGIRFTDEAFQEKFEDFIGNADVTFGETPMLARTTQSFERDFKAIEVKAIEATVCLQRSEDASYHVDYAYYTSCPISVTEKGDTLIIEQKSQNFFSWFSPIGYGDTYITISIPNEQILDHISFNTISGDIRITETHAVKADQVHLNTTSGGIYVDSLKTDQAVFETVSGVINADVRAQNITFSTTSGEIIAGCVGDELNISTVSGEVDMHKLSFQNAVFSSVSGNLSLTVTDPPESISLQFDTVSGERVTSADPSVMNGNRFLNVETVSGKLTLLFE